MPLGLLLPPFSSGPLPLSNAYCVTERGPVLDKKTGEGTGEVYCIKIADEVTSVVMVGKSTASTKAKTSFSKEETERIILLGIE